jgi:hypothetical protein
MSYNRLILKLAAFDVFALFAAWYHAQWDFVKQLADQAWAQRVLLPPLGNTDNLDALYPLLLLIAACLLAALYLSNLRRDRLGQSGENLQRFQQASEHARAIDHRIASTKVIFELPERRKAPRSDGSDPVSWRPPPSMRAERPR